MKYIFSFVLSLSLLINSIGYAIEWEENLNRYNYETLIQVGYKDEFFLSSDAGTTQEYVHYYAPGSYTGLQVCSVGSKTLGKAADHKYEKKKDGYYIFNKSEIIEIVEPTCTENGHMTIKCRHVFEKGWGIFASQETCGKTANIILEKTGHSSSNHSVGGKCLYCEESHGEGSLLEGEITSRYHYYSCT